MNVSLINFNIVQDLLKNFFNGKELNKSINPDEKLLPMDLTRTKIESLLGKFEELSHPPCLVVNLKLKSLFGQRQRYPPVGADEVQIQR